MLHIGGIIRKLLFGADVLDGGHQHEGPQVFHAAAFVKEDLEHIGEGAGSGRCSRRCIGLGLIPPALNLCDKAINFL